jgi:hypothetical protein
MSKSRTIRRSMALYKALVAHAEELNLELVSYKRVDQTTIRGAYRAMHELHDRMHRTGELQGEATDRLTKVTIVARWKR